MAIVTLHSQNFSTALATRLTALGSGWQIRGVDSIGSPLTDVKTFTFGQSGSVISNALEIVFSPATVSGSLAKFQIWRPTDVIGTNDPYFVVAKTGVLAVGSVVRVPVSTLRFDFNNANVCAPDDGGWTPVSGADAIFTEILGFSNLYVNLTSNLPFQGVPALVTTFDQVGVPANTLENTSVVTFTSLRSGSLSQISVGSTLTLDSTLFSIGFNQPISMGVGQQYTINASDISVVFDN